MECSLATRGWACVSRTGELRTCVGCKLTFHHLCCVFADSCYDPSGENCLTCEAAKRGSAAPAAGSRGAGAGPLALPVAAATGATVAGAAGCLGAPENNAGGKMLDTSQPTGWFAMFQPLRQSSKQPRTSNAASAEAKRGVSQKAAAAVAAAAAKNDLEGAAAVLAAHAPPKHELARARVVSINDGGARKRKSGSADARTDGVQPADSKPLIVEDSTTDTDTLAAAPAAKKARAAAAGRPAAATTNGGERCKVPPAKRLHERHDGKTLAEHGFVVNPNNARQLFCLSCSAPVNTKKDRITDHIKSLTHQRNAEKEKRREERFVYINEALEQAQENNQVGTGAHADTGRGVTVATARARVQLLESWLAAGIPIAKMNGVRDTLQRLTRVGLTSHMNDLIPIINSAHRKELKEWLKDNQLCLALDTASREGECFALTARIINSKTFQPETRLIAVRLYESSFNGAQLACVLNGLLGAELGIAPGNIIATVRDRAAYGKISMRTLTPLWQNALDMECFAHTFNHVGENMHHTTLTNFTRSLSHLWSKSHRARVMWRDMVGVYPPSSADNRWWSWCVRCGNKCVLAPR